MLVFKPSLQEFLSGFSMDVILQTLCFSIQQPSPHMLCQVTEWLHLKRFLHVSLVFF